MTNEEIEKIIHMCQRQALVIGFMYSLLDKFKDHYPNLDPSTLEFEQYNWVKEAIENLFYLDKPLPVMP